MEDCTKKPAYSGEFLACEARNEMVEQYGSIKFAGGALLGLVLGIILTSIWWWADREEKKHGKK